VTNIIKIPTANLPKAKTVSLSDSNNDRQPEMAAETRNYLSTEISTANLGFTVYDHIELEKVLTIIATTTRNRK